MVSGHVKKIKTLEDKNRSNDMKENKVKITAAKNKANKTYDSHIRASGNYFQEKLTSKIIPSKQRNQSVTIVPVNERSAAKKVVEEEENDGDDVDDTEITHTPYKPLNRHLLQGAAELIRDSRSFEKSVAVVPVDEGGAEKKVVEKEENDGDDNDGDYRFTPANNNNDDGNSDKTSSKPHRIRSLAFTPEQHLGNFGDHDVAREIHDQFHIHEEGLKRKTERRQKKAKRKTQMRLQARTKLKDSKALSKIKSFSKLKENEVNEIIESMDHIVRFKGDTICRQFDVSDSFYIIVKGSASVTVNVVKKKKNNGEMESDDDEDEDVSDDDEDDETEPEQVEVATIETLGFFGEGALIAGDEPELRTATVTISSKKCVLLRLKRSNFLKLMETNTTFTRKEDNDEEGIDNKSIIEQMKETRNERTKSNRLLMQNRNSSDLLGGGGGGDDDGGGLTNTRIPPPPPPPLKYSSTAVDL
jgi:CRP-like cAMP-binding protein